MASPRGGNDPVRQEVVLGGPFAGFSADSANWFKTQGGILQDAENVDFLKGQMISRPGYTLTYSTANFTALALSNANAEARYSDTQTPRRFLYTPGYYPLLAARFNMYFGLSTNKLGQFPTQSVINGPVRYAVAYLLADLNASGATSANGAGGGAPNFDLSKEYYVGAKIHMTDGTDVDGGGAAIWHTVTSQSSSTLTISPAWPMATPHKSNAYIVFPIQFSDTNFFWPGEGGIVPIPATEYYVFPCGESGAVLLDNSTGTPAFSQLQNAADPTKYLCRAAAYYNARVLLATPASEYVSGGVWTAASHKGRIAYSASGSPRDFSGLGSGVFDLEIGDVFDLFVMRDTLYAVGENGIASIQKTGNSYMPFRAQTILQSPMFSFSRAAVVDGAYAVIRTPGGLVRFDGGAITPMGEGSQEIFRSAATTYNTASVTWKSLVAYDPSRKRVLAPYNVAGSSGSITTPAKVLVVDTTTGGVTRFSPASSSIWANIYDMAYFQSEAAALQEDEYIVLADTGLVTAARSTTSDGGSAIAWYGTSPVLDAQTSRDNKSCDRIRLTYEDWAASTTTVQVDLYVDGGTSAAVTKTVNIGGSGGKATKTAYITFPAVTGQQWCVKLSGSNTTKVVINQVALYFVARQEAKPT